MCTILLSWTGHNSQKQTALRRATMKSSAAFLVLSAASAAAFGPSAQRPAPAALLARIPAAARSRAGASGVALRAASVAADGGDASSAAADGAALTKQQRRLRQIREEGGPLAFNTKYGALSPYAIYYGLVSIGLGLVWFVALTLCQLFYKLTGDRVDKRRRLPVFFSHVWGTLLMALTGCFPKIENGEIIKEFHKRWVGLRVGP